MFPDKNYVLGSGELYFAAFAPGTRVPAEGQAYFGNSTEFNLSVESDTLDHFDTDHGVRTKDDSVLLEKNMSGAMVVDHISPANVAKWLTGFAAVATQAAATASTLNVAEVKLGTRYQLGVSPSNPSGVRGVTNVTAVKEDTPTDVNLVLGTDYKVDAETGGFVLLKTAANIEDGDEMTITFDVSAVSFNRITTGNGATLEGELFYKSFNAKGQQLDYYFPYVQLAPDGDYALKGDDWQQLGFTVQVLQRDNDTAVAYANGRPGMGV